MALTLTLGTGPSFGQNQLQFIKVNPTIEGAIQLNWASNPNEYYEIDYANEVLDQTQGGTIWLPLLEDYPSQGTNTLFLDTGNYFIDPAALHPSKSPMRFYRIVLSGTNTASAPFVSIVSPTNGDSVSDVIYVSVSASSDQPFVFTKLYVDGEEMQEASSTTNYLDNGTNYVLSTYILNTCEWPNGSHSLFATAECQSGPSGTHDIPAPLIGRAASTFVAVAYSNLVTRVAFSEPFFMPEDGQIQIVSAVFAANVNWTLQIQDANTNTVRTATGSGASMAFNWDGTGDGGTSLPVGNYTYLLAAQTNGEPLTHGQVRNKTLNGEVEHIPPPPMPPVRVHGHFVPWQAVYGPVRVFPDTVLLPDEIASPPAPYGGSGSQSTRAPVRPPTAPTRGRGGFFGIAYDTYRGVASGYTVQNPDNGLNIGVKIGMEGSSGDHAFTYPVLREYISEAHNFITEMKRGNWSMSFDRFDDALSISDLRGSGANIFNNVKLGLLLLHGTYGTDPDYTANQCEQMYLPITSGATAEYLRMSEMDLGSSDPNGLKWMAIAACNSLYQPNWFNMQNSGVQPFNNNLHLLFGTDSIVWTHPHVMSYWARYITRGKIVLTPMKIEEAWYLAARDAYAEYGYNYTNAMFFAVTGDAACRGDTLQTNSVPIGSPFYNRVQVWP